MGYYAYEICGPSVVSEIIDGEAIIMDMASGTYFSTDGVGARVWQDVMAGLPHEQILAAAAAAYPQAPQARQEVDAFLSDLAARGLVQQGPARRPTATSAAPAAAWGGVYRTPTLSSHEDMQDLIQLDPIHDVDQVGWPIRKVDT